MIYDLVNNGLLEYAPQFDSNDNKALENESNRTLILAENTARGYAGFNPPLGGALPGIGNDLYLGLTKNESTKNNNGYSFHDSAVFTNNFTVTVYLASLKFSMPYKQLKTQSIYNSSLLLIFIFINIFITFIFMKRKIDENISNIATLKALGFRTSKVVGTYLIFPLFIVLTGGTLGILNAL
jgi:hypothetical protein